MIAVVSLEPSVDDLANFDIIKKVSYAWQLLGTRLGQTQNELDNYSRISQMDNDTCCTRVFQHWISNGGSKHYPLSWQSVCDLLCAIGHRGTAGELRLALAAK